MRIATVFKGVTLNWLRSRSGLFFSFLFPILFLLLFGAIFSGINTTTYSLAVQNNDLTGGVPSALSQSFIQALNSTKVISVSSVPPGVNVDSYIKNKTGFFGGNPRVLIIPRGFAADIKNNVSTSLTFVSSPSDQLAPQIEGVVAEVSSAFNFQIAGARPLINVTEASSSVKTLMQVDYYIPGLIAAFMMTNGVIGLTTTASEFKRSGLIKRLSATPLTKLDWMIGNVLSQSLLALILAFVMLVLGITIFHSEATIDGYTIVTLIVGAVLFSGMGMTLAGLISDPEAAAGLGNAVAFPMMFLSGTFWSLEIEPQFLQVVANFLPLTYFSNGLRDSMIIGNYSAALVNLGVSGAFAVAFIVLGAVFTRWKQP